MALDKYIEKNFPIICLGRDSEGKPILENSVKFKLKIYQRIGDAETISSDVSKCRYNTGGHGQRCRASHPVGVDKVDEGVICPYSFDIPYALEHLNKKC